MTLQAKKVDAAELTLDILQSLNINPIQHNGELLADAEFFVNKAIDYIFAHYDIREKR